MANASTGSHSTDLRSILLMSAVGIVGVSLLLAVLCVGAFIVHKKNSSNLYQGNNIEGLFSFPTFPLLTVVDYLTSLFRSERHILSLVSPQSMLM